MVVSLAANERGTGFICGHDDGSIIRYYISEDAGSQVSGRIIQHQTTPVALAWANGYIIAAGCDRRILFYDSQVGFVFTILCAYQQQQQQQQNCFVSLFSFTLTFLFP